MNTLELLYEKTIVPQNAIRKVVIEGIQRAEYYENWNEFQKYYNILSESEKRYLQQEGMFDRMKARGAQAMGAIKGAGQQLKGVGQKALGYAANTAGNLVNKAYGPNANPNQNQLNTAAQNLNTQGAQNIAQGQNAGQQAKVNNYIQSAANTISNDFNKLNIPLKDAAAFKQELLNLFQTHLSSATNTPVQQPQQQPQVQPVANTRPQQLSGPRRQSPSAKYGIKPRQSLARKVAQA